MKHKKLEYHPSLCYHKEIQIKDNITVCKKCFRIRKTVDGVHYFYYKNNVHYFTKFERRAK